MEPRPVPQQASALGLSYPFSANVRIFLGVSREMLHGVYRVCLQLIVDFLSKSLIKLHPLSEAWWHTPLVCTQKQGQGRSLKSKHHKSLSQKQKQKKPIASCTLVWNT